MPILTQFYTNHSRIEKILLLPSAKFDFQILSEEKNSQLETLIQDWVRAYLSGRPQDVALPLAHSFSSPFYKDAVRAIQEIPFGKTSSYKTIAENINCPKGARAVGNVCRLNPFPLVIPCHRVLASNGDLGGFAFGLPMKEDLLAFEKSLKSV